MKIYNMEMDVSLYHLHSIENIQMLIESGIGISSSPQVSYLLIPKQIILSYFAIIA